MRAEHIRTEHPEHRQPSELTREQFWKHLKRVYEDVDPELANKTKSILLFGVVVKDHKEQPEAAVLCDDHHHAPTYTSKHRS